MERLLEENSEERRFQGGRFKLLPNMPSVQGLGNGGITTTRVVLSGNSMEAVVKTIALINIVLGMTFLVGNIMVLFLMVSYPLHEFRLIEVTVHDQDPSHAIFHLANFSKKQMVLMLTLTLIYFLMETMLAKMLLIGAFKKSRSRCSQWLEMRRAIWLVHLMLFFYNLCDYQDPTSTNVVYVLGAIILYFGLSIFTVSKFIQNIVNNQDFAIATCHMQKT